MNFTEKTEEHTPLIEVIGYQFERVHTGVIKWLLDSEYQDVPMEEKRKIIERIYEKSHQSSPFASDQVEEIICHPEYAFARTRRIDLVVEIKMADGNRKYIVMEMKVDTIPGGKQLQGTYNDFCCRHSDQKDDTLFLLLLFGTAQVFKIPDVPPFHVWKLSDIIDVFQGVEVSHPIYAEWMRVLEREQDRARHVEERLAGIGGKEKDKGWKRHGYRNRFSFFYYLYDQLRKYSRHGAEQWKIHGSPHNPLMNFTWMPTTLFGKPVHVYFEFNYEHLFFKLADQEQKLTRDELTLLRKQVEMIFRQVSANRGNHESTKNKQGRFVSLYKWEFDFAKEGLAQVMDEVDQIIDAVCREICKWSKHVSKGDYKEQAE
ncbi:hypothetical protein A0O32_1777 [Anoxybacillus flavithermus]|uniref:hypothetical protein n=1 Tax=Anoxybacillus flavithermus TaxID=33934 RepID=UPI0007D987CC|nr:hypothetical protein [Anoxybacillus flavithermus]ASA97009.1 hypothetical protein CA592_09425 [Anoxybacillus flavithermus]OAO79349.1 hypothetical protein A0O32_1777 [Anoxybacillus flavithermus]